MFIDLIKKIFLEFLLHFFLCYFYLDYNGWSGALLALYQLVKIYEYKKADERTPLTEAMNLLLPMIYQLMINLMASEQTEQNVLLQKQILKIFHTLTQVSGAIFNLGIFVILYKYVYEEN